jgi:hypothetical protein
MADELEYITIFRSAEMSAAEEARTVRDMLSDAGMSPVIVGDDVPGVVEGTYEVRVPLAESQQAEEIVAARAAAGGEVDTSPELDFVPIFSSQNSNAEIEALSIKSILDANNIPALVVEGPGLPNLPHEVRVRKDQFEQAERILEEARAAGPQAAEEASQPETF